MTIPQTSCALRAAVVAALALVAVLAQADTALAHAALVSTSPGDRAMVEAAPSNFALTFSEPVSPLTLTLVRPDGSPLPLATFAVRDRTVEIDAPEGLGRGTHVLSWRVVSEDGHPVGGSVGFSIGETSAAPAIPDPVDAVVRAGVWLAKVALYLGLFVGVGGVFALRVLMPGLSRGGAAIAAVLAAGAVGATASVPLQGLDGLGAPLERIAEPLVWSTGFGTSYGRTVVAALIAFVLAALGLLVRRRVANLAAVAALAAGGTALALSGHASAAAPQWLMRPAVFLHAATVAVWVGALIPLGLALRSGDAAAVPALTRFSRLVPAAVAVLVAAGAVLAVVQVEHPRALVETAYGRVFLVKLALLAILFALVAVNRWRLTLPSQAGEPTATRRLVRSIGIETLVVLLILGTVATWRFTPPPRALAAAVAQPASLRIHTAKAMADVTVTPGRAGPVDVGAYLMTGDFGPLAAKEVTFVFSNPAAGIEPFKRPAESPGDGTWRVAGVVLPFPGTWTLRIDVLITDFDLVRLDGEIAIRPYHRRLNRCSERSSHSPPPQWSPRQRRRSRTTRQTSAI